MAEWFLWTVGIWKEYAMAEWLLWIFRIWVVIGICIIAANLKQILVGVRDINNKMEKLDGTHDVLPSIDSFLSSIRSSRRHSIPDDSEEGL